MILFFGDAALSCDVFITFSRKKKRLQVSIGSSFHANLYSYVGHDCVIGDFVTFAPSAKCNGNVVINNHAFVGTGAIIRPGRTGKPLAIGEAAVIGMGSVVTKDVPPGVTVFGNPAKIIKRSV